MNTSQPSESLNQSVECVGFDWAAVSALPFDEWERLPVPPDVEEWVRKVAMMTWSANDEHLTQPQYTTSIMRLLRIVAAAYTWNLNRLNIEKTELESALEAARDAEESIRARVELLRRENIDLHQAMKMKDVKGDGVTSHRSRKYKTGEKAELERLNEELHKSERDLASVRQENAELRRVFHYRNSDKSSNLRDNEKFQLEYKHLAAKNRRLVEKLRKSEEMLQELQCSDRVKRENEESELYRLRQRLRTLQQENYDLIQSRNQAEELCERREAEALRDMTELQQLHRDIVDEERQRFQSLSEEMKRMQSDAERHLEGVVGELRQKLRDVEEESSTLRRKLERQSTLVRPLDGETTDSIDLTTDSSASNSACMLSALAVSSLSKGEHENRVVQRLLAERERLQQENDRLSTELQQMEARTNANELESTRLRCIIEDEHGDVGFRRIQGESFDLNRSIELLQDENAQLRERLNAMEDSLAFSAALQELCIRIGVTQEEIDRLRPKSTALFSEVETLRAELATLKDEIEWLEKDRRHWMDKVRLQPLLDTKLRLELGLSLEQLKQLDHMVDQMKSGSLLVEEETREEENYKEKYFRELHLRRKEMEHFNDFVRQRIEEALREALGKKDFSSSPEATSALQFLRERVDLITTRPSLDVAQEVLPDAARLQEQLRSALQLLEQSELTIKDNAVAQAALREQLAAATAERDILMNERDKYRTAVFDALGQGVFPLLQAPTAGAEDDGHCVTGEEELPPLFPSIELSSSHPAPFPRTEGAAQLRPALQSSISRTFEEQLRVKDELIAALKGAIESARSDAAQHQAEEVQLTQKLAEAHKLQEDLRNQVLAIQQINEDVTGKLAESSKTVEDLHEALRCVDSGNTRELIQKIVVLRQREGKLLQRLRRAMEAREDMVRSEQTLREYVNSTFKSLSDALNNVSTGFVLPRSSSTMCMENEVLMEMQQRLEGVLCGRLFREDSAYVLHLQQAYSGMEYLEELNTLRTKIKNLQRQRAEMERSFGEQSIELERLQKLQAEAPASKGGCGGDSVQATRWETEAATWRQKCNLYMKRYEDKEREVSSLELELEDARQGLALLQEHFHNSMDLGGRDVSCVSRVRDKTPVKGGTEEEDSANGGTTGSCISKVRHLEREVARLKSINLGLLHYSLDMQGECKRLDIELEATKQELSLVRDAGDSRKVSEFVSAAIRQHASLRRQSELALLRAKRSQMQLCAAEANMHVAINEATTYKLTAFRLYRKYVAHMVAVLDYVRGVQRGVSGAVSPHRAEMMHQRFLNAVADVERSQAEQKELAVQLAESKGMVNALQQQVEIFKAMNEEERADTIHTKLMGTLAAVREKDVRITELQEDHHYLQQKLKRVEAHVQQLTEELARLELGATGVTSLDEDVLEKLLQLKETVFTKVETPAIVIQPDGVHRPDAGDTDTAIREYKQALDKQEELSRECASLKKRLDDEAAESRKAHMLVSCMKEEMGRIQERLQYTLRQLEEEREKAAEREKRAIRSHDAQAEVARRAAEHNSQCLRDMLQNKEGCIKQLQEQLQAERRKYLESQLEESARMERLHDQLFKENNAMVERFREAIDGVAENHAYSAEPVTGAVLSNGMADQLALLTKETLRLKAELRDARAANILLESQLNDQVARAQQHQTTSTGASVVGVINDQSAIIESLRQREFSLTRELQREKGERELLERQLHEVRHLVVEQGGVLKSVAAVGIVGTTGAVEQELRAQLLFAEQRLSEAQAQLVEERKTAGQLQVNSSHWRTQLDALREEMVRQQEDVERARRLVFMNESLNADIRRVEEQNEKLVMATDMLRQRLVEEAQQRGDASRMYQHELALAQRMGSIQKESMEQLKSVTERLNSIQRELEQKVQREEEVLKKHGEAQQMAHELHLQLQGKEQEMLRLRRELAYHSSLPSSQPQNQRDGREKGTQVLQTVEANAIETPSMFPQHEGDQRRQRKHEEKQQKKPQLQQQHPRSTSSAAASHIALSNVDTNILVQSQVAAIVQREIEKAQRENLHEISSLRAVIRRLEKDLEDCREQLRGERDINRSLRAQVQNAQREVVNKELVATRKYSSQSPRSEGQQEQPVGVSKPSPIVHPLISASGGVGSASNGRDGLSVPPKADAKLHASSRRLKEENGHLRQQVDRLKKRLAAFDTVVGESERYKKELAELRSRQLELVDTAHMASPLDIRSHKRTVLHLEGIIDSLRRELGIDKEGKLRHLEQRVGELDAENRRLTAELGRYQSIAATSAGIPVVLPRPLKAEGTNEKATLERELLEKNSTILDLRFEREALQLKVGRLERHIEDIIQIDSTNTKSTGTFKHRSRVETLETVVENLKLVVERLQHENTVLKSKTVSISKHMDLVRELREIRSREQQLREHSEKLGKRLLRTSTGGSAMSEQQAKLQRRLQTAHATMEQYNAEMLELRQQLDERKQLEEQEKEGDVEISGGEEAPTFRRNFYEGGNRRSVRPLDVSDDEVVPPPLPPGPQVTATASGMFSDVMVTDGSPYTENDEAVPHRAA